MRQGMTQTHIMACQLCPDVETMFQRDLVDPSDTQYKAAVQEIFSHLRDEHGVEQADLDNLRARPTMFADGANGYAVQTKHWFVPDDTKTGRVLVAYRWSQERRKKQAAR